MLGFERLEQRVLLAADFGDAPLPYSTLLAENGARHEAIGPQLGATRDTEADGLHSAAADADGADEDGVTFGAIQVGQLGATLTVNVQGGAALLDAWIDFDGDGSWGGSMEQIANNVAVVAGNNTLTFDVPSWAADGQTFARFRVSTAGNLAIRGEAADGEVEDYAVLLSPPSAAAGVFGGQNTISTAADSASMVIAADVDSDGDMDVLSASYFDDTIAWYENNGTQTFTERIISTTANGAASVFAADVDGDGDTDVLSASPADDKIAWYENDGTPAVGAWTARTISTAADVATSVFAADLDGDGDTDVLSASFADDTIAWYENNGTQTFTERTISTTANGAFSVFTADVDSDGDIDVLSASREDDKIAWYENNGSQTFTARTISTVADRAFSVFAADVDGDGDTDVLSASYLDDKIAWYENNGSETFTERAISTTADGAFDVFAADMDGDGDTDVLSASSIALNDKIAWYENDGSQAFTERVISTVANGAQSVFAADVDSDGDIDVLSASSNDDKIAWYEQLAFDFGDAPAPYPTTAAADGAKHDTGGPRLGAARDFEDDGQPSSSADGDGADDDGVTFGAIQVGQLGATATVNVQNAPAGAKLDAWIDFDRDGTWGGHLEQIANSDSVVAGDNTLTFDVPSWAADGQTFARFRLSTAGNLGVRGAAADGEVEDYALSVAPTAAANGVFAPPIRVSTAPDRTYSVFAADVDGDGDMDVLAASLLDDKISWYENDGNQTFTSRLVSAADSADSVFAADVDGDGDTDVLATKTGGVAWYENDGNQVFTERPVSAPILTGQSVFAADMDGDGDTDVVSSRLNPTNVVWYENDGSQVFTERTVGPAFDVRSLMAADVDTDGDLDVVATALNDDKVVWYENDGTPADGGFTERLIFNTNAPFAVFAADMDGDGDMDAVSAAASAVFWHQNNGNQVFTNRLVASIKSPRTVFAADMDGDGDMDVLSGSNDLYAGDKIEWYENDGSPAVGAWPTRSVATNLFRVRSLFAADIDGDGDLDAVSGSNYGNKVAWHENRTVNIDFGDAPAPYPTTRGGDGARHEATGPSLGAIRDFENDGQPSPAADGDAADEDGVTFGTLRAGQVGALLTVNVQNAAVSGAKLDGWIDFNADGDWNDAGEQVFGHLAFSGETILAFSVPASAHQGRTFARFRISAAGGLSPTGIVFDGEVEDYAVDILEALPVILPGDYNNNGVVDAADYVVWRNSLNQFITLPNDTTPGAVVQADYNVWRANFGKTAGSGAVVGQSIVAASTAIEVNASVAPVPEETNAIRTDEAITVLFSEIPSLPPLPRLHIVNDRRQLAGAAIGPVAAARDLLLTVQYLEQPEKMDSPKPAKAAWPDEPLEDLAIARALEDLEFTLTGTLDDWESSGSFL